MKVTLEGTQEQIEATLMPDKTNQRARKGESQNALRQKKIIEKRKIIRRAYDLVRCKKGFEVEEQKMLDGLKGCYSQSIMTLAERIIAERS